LVLAAALVIATLAHAAAQSAGFAVFERDFEGWRLRCAEDAMTDRLVCVASADGYDVDSRQVGRLQLSWAGEDARAGRPPTIAFAPESGGLRMGEATSRVDRKPVVALDCQPTREVCEAPAPAAAAMLGDMLVGARVVVRNRIRTLETGALAPNDYAIALDGFADAWAVVREQLALDPRPVAPVAPVPVFAPPPPRDLPGDRSDPAN
jgi:hypothetical protein